MCAMSGTLVPRPTFIVYVDDAAHARPLLAALHAGPARWLLVACAPRITQRASKWVSHRARENWRNQWADKLFAQLTPGLPAHAEVVPLLARQPLPELLAALQQAHGPAQVVDARRPKREAPSATPAPQKTGLPGLLAGMGGLLTFVCVEAVA